MNRAKIKHDNKTYFVTPAENNPRKSNSDCMDYFMYRVEDENEEIVGCVTFTWSRTARAVASSLVFRNEPEEEIAYLALIPHLPFFPDLVQNLYSTCFRYMFNTFGEGLEINKTGYSIKVENGFMRTMQKIIFSGQPTDDQVRRHILIAFMVIGLTILTHSYRLQ